MKFSVSQVSHKGGREKNEDRMGYSYTHNSALFLLADGMGGHPQGEVAAQLALQSMAAWYQRTASAGLRDIPRFFESAVLRAHHRILRHAAESGLQDTPRTTLVAALVQDGAVHWMHCGDSRLYLLRAGELLARTRDHSFLERRREAASVFAEPLGFNRNVLYSCVGAPKLPVCDIGGPLPLQPGDKLLLCSDGLWGSVPDTDIVRHLSQQPVAVAAPELVERALQKAGFHSDNVTLVALEWEAPDAPAAAPETIDTDPMDRAACVSTVPTSPQDAADHALDDAAIASAIADLNAPLRPSPVRKP